MKKKNNSNIQIFINILFLLTIIIIIINFLSLYSIKNTTPFKEKKNSIQFQNNINTICDHIKNEQQKNYCFLKNSQCDNIINPYYKYMCKRLVYRTHILAFLSTPEYFKNNSKYNKFYNQINVAIKKFKLLEHSNEISCNNLENDLLQGECQFYLAISVIPKFIDNVEIYFPYFLDFCSNISNPSWRSECFYIIADELTLNSDSNIYFDKITQACTKSDDAHPYSCINHNALLMKDRILNFCNFVPIENKEDCFRAYGKYIGYSSKNDKVSICKKSEYEKPCIFGLLRSLKSTIHINKTENLLNYCNNISKKYTELCYEIFGELIIQKKIENNPQMNINQHCNLVPKTFIKNCHFGFGKELHILTHSNLTMSLNYCKNVESKYQKYCYNGIIDRIESYINTKPKKGIWKCNLFPLIYQNDCTNHYFFD